MLGLRISAGAEKYWKYSNELLECYSQIFKSHTILEESSVNSESVGSIDTSMSFTSYDRITFK